MFDKVVWSDSGLLVIVVSGSEILRMSIDSFDEELSLDGHCDKGAGSSASG